MNSRVKQVLNLLKKDVNFNVKTKAVEDVVHVILADPEQNVDILKVLLSLLEYLNNETRLAVYRGIEVLAEKVLVGMERNMLDISCSHLNLVDNFNLDDMLESQFLLLSGNKSDNGYSNESFEDQRKNLYRQLDNTSDRNDSLKGLIDDEDLRHETQSEEPLPKRPRTTLVRFGTELKCESALGVLCKSFCYWMERLFAADWVQRHGAILGIKAIVEASFSRSIPMLGKDLSTAVCYELFRMLVLDRFCDFVEDDTSFPVREVTASVIATLFCKAKMKEDVSGKVNTILQDCLKSSNWNLKIDGLLVLRAISKIDPILCGKTMETVLLPLDANFFLDRDLIKIMSETIKLSSKEVLNQHREKIVIEMISACEENCANDEMITIPISLIEVLPLLRKIGSEKVTTSFKTYAWKQLLYASSDNYLGLVKSYFSSFRSSLSYEDGIYASALFCKLSVNFDASQVCRGFIKDALSRTCSENYPVSNLRSAVSSCILLLPGACLPNSFPIQNVRNVRVDYDVNLDCLQDNFIWLSSQLWSLEKLGLIETYLSSTAYLNLRHAILVIIYCPVLSDLRSSALIEEKLFAILGARYFFDEVLAKFAIIKSSLSDFTVTSLEKPTKLTIENIEKFTQAVKSVHLDQTNLIALTQIENTLGEIKASHQKLWIDLKLLAACALLRLKNDLEKVSPLLNPILNGLKMSASEEYLGIAAGFACKVFNEKLSKPAKLKFVASLSKYLENKPLLASVPEKIDFGSLTSEDLFIDLSNLNRTKIVGVFFALNQNEVFLEFCNDKLSKFLGDPIVGLQSIANFITGLLLFDAFPSQLMENVFKILQLSLQRLSFVERMLGSILFAFICSKFPSEAVAFLQKRLDDVSQTFSSLLCVKLTCLCFTDVFKEKGAVILGELAPIFFQPVLSNISTQNDDVRNLAFNCLSTLLPIIANNASVYSQKKFHFKSLKLSVESQKQFDASCCMVRQFFNNEAIEPCEIPASVSAELRPYQREAVDWLHFLKRFHLNGVLADDLGLGKTLMCICTLASPHSSSKVSLVVCPKSLAYHWKNEIQTFCPSLNAVCCLEKGVNIIKSFKNGVIITSYQFLKTNSDYFTQMFHYIILDEGHFIRNPESKVFRAVSKLRGEHRLILTGTPIQNSVGDLWALFEFLMPGYISSSPAKFRANFANPIKKYGAADASSKQVELGAQALRKLHEKVLPFILRREKETVLKHLPPKTIQDILCEMTHEQKLVYSKVEAKFSSLSKDKMNSFKLLKILTQICNSPKLVDKGYPEESGKMQALKELLDSVFLTSHETIAHPHRAIVFFQSKAMMNFVQARVLDSDKFKNCLSYSVLDSSKTSSERFEVVKQFNSDPSIDLLLSTKAVGGVGLNLTGADTVIFVEHDFNPVTDLQAMDRAHRIGQTRPVVIYRLITMDSIEQKIMNVQNFKTAVAKAVVNEDNSSTGAMSTYNITEFLDERNQSSATTSNSKNLLDDLDHLWEPLSKLD